MNPFSDKIRETVTILVNEFTRFRRMSGSSFFHIYSCLFLDIKKCSSCHVAALKVGFPWDLKDGINFGHL